MEEYIICSSCGAKMKPSLEKCPYCDNTNLPGAELAYMEKLQDIRQDLEGLENVPEQEAKKALRKQSRKLLAIGGILAALVVGTLIIGTLLEHRVETEHREQILWLREHGMQWDEWYEAEEYEPLINAYKTELEKGSPTWCWEHCDFLSLMEYNMGRIEHLLEQEKLEPLTESQRVDLFYNELRIYQSTRDQYGLDRIERERIALLGGAYLEDLFTRWGMSEEEVGSFLQESGGYVDYEACREYVRTHPDSSKGGR